jgi:hypothetical protein
MIDQCSEYSMKVSEALQILLRSYKRDIAAKDRWCSNYICVMANDLAWEGKITPEAAKTIRLHIEGLIGGDYILQDWLVENGHVESYDVFNLDGATEKLQVTRIAWIEDMIRYFKEKENAANAECIGTSRESFVERTIASAKNVFQSAVAKVSNPRNAK